MIVLAGMIGIGKTTYTEKLARELGTHAFYEPVDTNPILDKYYDDPDTYGFSLQIYFLNKRFKSIKEAYKDNNNVLDRSIYEDALFTRINTENGSISEEQFGVYLELLDNMMEEIDALPKKAPDLLVYLDGSFDHVLDNIKKRGRVYEQPEGNEGLIDYYRQLHNGYADWYREYDKGPKISIPTDKYDIHNPEDWNKVYDYIRREMKQLKLI